MKTKTCKQCGRDMGWVTPGRLVYRTFCSTECNGLSKRKNPVVFLGGVRYYITGDGRYYLSPRTGMLHRVIWESTHGKLSKNLVIHHINGNGLDNRIENLVAVSQKTHMEKHHWRDIPAVSFVCQICGDEFIRKLHLARRMTNKYCSKKCADVGLRKTTEAK